LASGCCGVCRRLPAVRAFLARFLSAPELLSRVHWIRSGHCADAMQPDAKGHGCRRRSSRTLIGGLRRHVDLAPTVLQWIGAFCVVSSANAVRSCCIPVRASFRRCLSLYARVMCVLLRVWLLFHALRFASLRRSHAQARESRQPFGAFCGAQPARFGRAPVLSHFLVLFGRLRPQRRVLCLEAQLTAAHSVFIWTIFAVLQMRDHREPLQPGAVCAAVRRPESRV
jgi:hypothetical protein